mgnify:CR=1 FL=1
MSIAVRMRKDGRVIIPWAYRQLYNLQEGDIVELEILKVKHPDGTVVDLSDAVPQEAME